MPGWTRIRIRVSNHTGDVFSNAYPCGGLLVMSALDLKSGSMSCLQVRCLHAKDSSDSPLVQHLLTNQPSRFIDVLVHRQSLVGLQPGIECAA